MNILKTIKEYLGYSDKCFKHKVKFKTRGWYDERYCPKCLKESWARWEKNK